MATLPDPLDHRKADRPILDLFLRRWSPRAMTGEPLTGDELMTLFGRPPGPWIKPVKEGLLAAVLDGQLGPEDKEGAARLAHALLAEGAGC